MYIGIGKFEFVAKTKSLSGKIILDSKLFFSLKKLKQRRFFFCVWWGSNTGGRDEYLNEWISMTEDILMVIDQKLMNNGVRG